MIAKVSFVASMLIASVAAVGDGHRPASGNWYIPNYTKQQEWAGACQAGMRQSPINIVTADSATRYGDFQLRGSGFRNMPNAILNMDAHEMYMGIDEGSVWASDRDEKPKSYRPFEV
jgi:carbonic anhydrase